MNKKIQLLSLALLFFLPFIVASILFYSNITPVSDTRNHGVLLSPPLATATLIEKHDRQWKLALLQTDLCQQACQQQLFLLRQIQTSLGKHQDRLDYLLLSSTDLVTDKQVLALHPKLQQLKLTAVQMAQLIVDINPVESSINLPSQMTNQQTAYMVLIDPLGNLLIKWPISNQELPKAGDQINTPTQKKAKGILSDIKHLLKLSRIG
ncbi:hypothetical protein [Pelagibaculum spongiae]|uniref:Uncharacterized protein n=1 Tax=Pelagibaculum spongiae TaxID=2080658 RepID=A0A2V1H598_9GAMM|nr:hypothetical protein [Pelagibaculum spongiae]PVZ72428.1 hypothetical protein DC094_05335 [Pelagibaculum spongiae]